MELQQTLVEIINDSGFGKLVRHEDREKLRGKIAKFENILKTFPQVEPPLRHYFSKGVYSREIKIPKGAVIVGKIHKHKNMNIISQGKASFFSIDGSFTVEAPHTFVASPGVKRVIYAHEDTTWTTIHGTDETDLEKIEDEFIAKDYDAVYLSTGRTLEDVLDTLGFTKDELTQISERDDVRDFPCEVSVEVKDSPIHGKGIFATSDFKAGETIGPAIFEGLRTPLGRYTNHSGDPNAEGLVEDGGVRVVALKDIKSGEEILTDYYFNYTKTRGDLCHGG